MYLVSSCLVGVNCKYNGGNNLNSELKTLYEQGKAIAICPEVLGKLPIPRECCEIINTENGKKVISQSGKDYTQEYIDGANKALEICKIAGIRKAILQPRSPSCGCGTIYDGKFNGKLIDGNGITTDLLIENGIEVVSANDFKDRY